MFERGLLTLSRPVYVPRRKARGCSRQSYFLIQPLLHLLPHLLKEGGREDPKNRLRLRLLYQPVQLFKKTSYILRAVQPEHSQTHPFFLLCNGETHPLHVPQLLYARFVTTKPNRCPHHFLLLTFYNLINYTNLVCLKLVVF